MVVFLFLAVAKIARFVAKILFDIEYDCNRLSVRSFLLLKIAICRAMMNLEFSLAEVDITAARVAEIIGEHLVVAFHGEMGAGKTTFISALCKALGSTDNIGSPTFSIINEYNTVNGKIIYHMDWYRIKDEAEAIDAGVEDALYSGNICLVEWPEKAGGLLPDDTMHCYIESKDPGNRIITISEID
ncbi:hypothetical protein BH10BAC3_BH10BAC3_32630 [soil metagenome]